MSLTSSSDMIDISHRRLEVFVLKLNLHNAAVSEVIIEYMKMSWILPTHLDSPTFQIEIHASIIHSWVHWFLVYLMNPWLCLIVLPREIGHIICFRVNCMGISLRVCIIMRSNTKSALLDYSLYLLSDYLVSQGLHPLLCMALHILTMILHSQRLIFTWNHLILLLSDRRLRNKFVGWFSLDLPPHHLFAYSLLVTTWLQYV